MTNPFRGDVIQDNPFTQDVGGNPFRSDIGEGGVAAPTASDLPSVSESSPDDVRGILERIRNDKATRVATLQTLLQRQDISPAQRQRVQRLLDLEHESFFINAREEDRSAAENFFRGLADAATRFGAIGAADLAVTAARLPLRALSAVVGKDLDPLEGLQELTRGGMEAAKLLIDPEGKAGLAGQVTGVLGGALAGGNPLQAAGRFGAYGRAALSPWAVLNSAGMRAVAARSPAAAKIIEAGTTAGATFGQRVLAQAVGGGAVDAVSAIDIITGPGDFEEKAKALAIQLGLSSAGALGAAIPQAKIPPKPPAAAEPPKPDVPVVEARQALDAAKKKVTRSRMSRQRKAAQSWNQMTPEQRQQIAPGMAPEEYELNFSKLPPERKKIARAAIEELLPPDVDTSTPNTETAQLKAENDELRARVAEQLNKRRTESREARQTERRLVNELNSDKLTGVGSSRAFQTLYERKPGGLWALFDVASLKAMNDANGHPAGDQILIKAAIAIKGAAEEFGIDPRNVFRAGEKGDEFVVWGQDREVLDKVIARAIELYGDTEIPNTNRRTRLFGGTGETIEAADEAIRAARQGQGEAYERAPSITKLEQPQSSVSLAERTGLRINEFSGNPVTDPNHPIFGDGETVRLLNELASITKDIMGSGFGPEYFNALDKRKGILQQLADHIDRDQVYQYLSKIERGPSTKWSGGVDDWLNHAWRAGRPESVKKLKAVREFIRYIDDLENDVEFGAYQLDTKLLQDVKGLDDIINSLNELGEDGFKRAMQQNKFREQLNQLEQEVKALESIVGKEADLPVGTKYGPDAEDLPTPQAAATPEPAPPTPEPARTITPESPASTTPEPAAVQTPRAEGAQHRIQEPPLVAREAWIDQYVAGGKRTREGGQRAWRALTDEQRLEAQQAHIEGKPLPHVPKLRTAGGARKAKVVDPEKALDKIEADLDKRLEAGEITEDQHGRLWADQVGEPRMRLKKAAELEQAREEHESLARLTPEEVDAQEASMQTQYPELLLDEATLRQMQAAGKAQGGIEGTAMRQIANRALRFIKPLKDFGGDKLHSHLTELQGMLSDANPTERELIKARLAEVATEIKNRERPNPLGMMNNERGAILMFPKDRRVLQKGTDVPDYQRSVRSIWVKGHGLNRVSSLVEEAITNPAQSWADLMYNVRRKLQNANLPLREISKLVSGGKLEAFKDPYVWAQLFSGWATRADTFLFGRPFSWDLNGNIVELNVRGLRQIVQEVGGSYDDFVDYLIAVRQIETGKVGIPMADAERVVANAPQQFIGWAREVAQYSDALLKYAADAGLVSGKSLELLTDLYKNYIPLHRIFEGEAVASPVRQIVGPRAISTKAHGPGKPLYRLVGSTEQIEDPIQAIVENTRRLIRDADMNRVATNLLDLAEAEPAKLAGIIEIIKDEKHRLSPRNQKLFAEFAEQIKELRPGTDDQTIAQLFDSLNRERLGRKNDLLIAYRNGKRHKMRVRSDVAEAFGAMSPKHMQWYVQLLAAPTKLLKGGIVLQPLFSPLAFFKDIFEATARSQYGFKPWDSFIGFGIAISDTPIAKMLGITPSEHLRAFRSGGGAFTALSGVEARTTKAAYSYVVKGRGPKGTLLHPVDALKRWARPFEEAARLGEFRLARTQGASVLEASVAARNVTVDFTQAGTTMQALNVIFPFLNPAIQSLTADMSAIRRNPARVLAVGTGLALGSLMLAAANENDQEINDLRKTPYGSLFWWMRLPNGEIAKVPKPYFFGQLFATGAERAWDEMKTKDPESARRWRDAVIEQVAYTSMPALAQWGAALYANKLPFTGAPIESDEMADLDPAFRVTPRTSALATKLAGAVNTVIESLPIDDADKHKLEVSPVRVDALLGMAVGSIGRDVRAIGQYLSTTRHMNPEPVTADLPVVGRLFGRYPSNNVEPVYYFYERAERTERVVNTLDMLIKHRPDEYSAYLNKHVEDYVAAGVLAGTRKSMADVRRSIKEFEQLEGLDPKSKRELIDAQMRVIIDMARMANDVDRSIRERRTSR